MPDTTEEAELAPPAPEVIETTPEVAAPAETEGQPELTEEQIQDLSPDDALAYLEGRSIEIPDKPKVEAKPEAEETPAEVEATPPAATEEPAVPPEKILPNRIATSQFDTDEQKAINLMHVLNEGKKPGDPGRIGLREALSQLETMESKGKAATPPAPTAVEAMSADVTKAEADLSALRQKRTEAIAEGEPVTEIEDQIETARDVLSEAKMEAKLAQRDAERQQAQEVAAKVQTAQQQRASIQADVVKEFSTVADAASPLGIAVTETIADLRNEDHPDNALLHTVAAPRHVLNEALNRLAKKEGISFAQAVSKYATPQAPVAAKPPATAPKPAAPPVKKALPASGSQATQPPKGLPTVQDVYDSVKDDGDGERAWEAIYGSKPLNLLRP